MGQFILDTSGVVRFDGGTLGIISWDGVGQRGGAFAQGYIEAALREFADGEGNIFQGNGRWAAFTSLAPETLAAMLKDCEADVEVGRRLNLAGNTEDRTSAKAGRTFWDERQSGSLFDCPPVTLHLGDDGLIYLQAKGRADGQETA